jgi:hypothetical protein
MVLDPMTVLFIIKITQEIKLNREFRKTHTHTPEHGRPIDKQMMTQYSCFTHETYYEYLTKYIYATTTRHMKSDKEIGYKCI